MLVCLFVCVFAVFCVRPCPSRPAMISVNTSILPLCLCLLSVAMGAGPHQHHHRHGGLFPDSLNLARLPGVRAWSNGTCGSRGPEVYCRPRGRQCATCDLRLMASSPLSSGSQHKSHPPESALDDRPDTWWQSSSLAQGLHFERVDFTIDLGQEFEIEAVRLKMGPSPRPGGWLLERAGEDQLFTPWTAFSSSEELCASRYPTVASCLTAFSRATPHDSGEIYVGLDKLYPELTEPELTGVRRARYLRFSFDKMAGGSAKLEKARHGSDLANRFYYSLRDVNIQGRCLCHGHAAACSITPGQKSVCECAHHTQGADCSECLPLYRGAPWRPGTSREANPCLRCECNGHGTSCSYPGEEETGEESLVDDRPAKHRTHGGGVCVCTNHTRGPHCDDCEPGWYRPAGVGPAAPVPCLPCQCTGPGSTGHCVSAPEGEDGESAGAACECREGFSGSECQRCAPGYKNFPTCQPCSCDPRGMLSGTSCQSQCYCKVNVEGERCERCKPGHFFLDSDNPDGCTECYCSYVSKECRSAKGFIAMEVNSMEGWKVSDLTVSLVVEPYRSDPDSARLSVADNQLPPELDSYYWLAPQVYRKNKLTSYGSSLTFTVSWDVMRGDTSGRPTAGPDLVLIGENGLKIGYGNTWHKSKNMSITVPLVEEGWYLLLEEESRDVIARLRRRDEPWKDFRGQRVSRGQLMSVLADLRHLLVRAKYHTDQAEGSLDSCILEVGTGGGGGSSDDHHQDELQTIEACVCPAGYSGLSCEQCAYGYARLTHEGPLPRHHPICTKCNCHGHAQTCDPISGQCSPCEHNTTGVQCERCAEGYYGEATTGTVTDCKRCLCPLDVASNNFSPLCQADSHGYLCTACPTGYTGRHCEKCDAGYFGNPEEVGSVCSPCDCDGGPCDHLTGRCKVCHGNTEGPQCQHCKPHHYGSPNTTGCFPCDCSEMGSVGGESCDLETGQCKCKPHYTGRACDTCQSGLGNVSAGCLPCACDSPGAASPVCDPTSGNCLCRPGVTGSRCQLCLERHFNYSSLGCAACDCHGEGSTGLTCHPVTGECSCREHVVGRTCSSCQVGYWGLSGTGCQACDCDPMGSIGDACDLVTGQCHCKPGVAGRKCDHCQSSHYNMTIQGCSECDPCELAGHICDPDTGACVCPPNTAGPDCGQCRSNTWDFHPVRGCKECDCDKFGSVAGKCSAVNGSCECLPGYGGVRCEECTTGYFGFPSCRPCNCHLSGTLSGACQTGLCECHSSTGQCPCKENAVGQRCDSCREGTFGLRPDDPAGCTECFCFGRSRSCADAGLGWSSLRAHRSRHLAVHYDINDTALTTNIYPVNTQEVCYINLALPGSGGGMVKRNEKQLNVTNNLRILPGEEGNIELGVNYLFDAPVYWQLPRIFLGDKILSYGGFLRFCSATKGESTLLPVGVLESYPLVQLQGNSKLVLEHFPTPYHHPPPPSSTTNHCHTVRLHESLWKQKNNPEDAVSRGMLMTALQNLQHIFIRASDSVDFAEADLWDVSLDIGTVPLRSAAAGGTGLDRPVTGLELCDCPPSYNSSSCQDPGLGFYRERGPTVSSTIIIQLVGEAVPCECNGRAVSCHPESGHCLSCSEQTSGRHCEECAEGYYGSPSEGVGCQPCPCPSAETNHAVSCSPHTGDQSPLCVCRPGYTGSLCNRCSEGYYGSPEALGGSCKPCACNPLGSVSPAECDPLTGRCTCKPGSTGRDCSRCSQPRHVLIDTTGCSKCSEPCVSLLLDTVEELTRSLEAASYPVLLAGGGPFLPSRDILTSFKNKYRDLNETWFTSRDNYFLYDELSNYIDNDFRMKLKHLQNKVKKTSRRGGAAHESALEVKTASDEIMQQLASTREDIHTTVEQLERYIEGDSEQISISAMLHEAKQVLARVRDTDLEASKRASADVLRLCNNTLKDLRYLVGDGSEVEQLYERLENLAAKLEDFATLSNQTILKKSNTVDIYKEGARKSEILKSRNKDIENFYTEAENTLNTTDYLNNVAQVNIQEAADNLEAVVSLKSALHHSSRLIEKRANILRHNNEQYFSQYVEPAKQRADELMNTTEKYMGMFKKDAGIAMKASKAYQEIIDSLLEAESAVLNASLAADVAYEKAYPGVGTDSLLDQASGSRELSAELSRRAEDQLARVFALSPQLVLTAETLARLEESLGSAGASLTASQRQILELVNRTDSIRDSALETVIQCEKTEAASQQVLDDVADLNLRIQTKLRPQVQQLEFDGEISLNTAQDIIDEAQANTKKALEMVGRLTLRLNEQNRRFNEWNDSISNSLELLRNKITQAHHIANSITLSMTSIGDGAGGGSCVRTYEPDFLGPGTLTSIVLTYAISSQLRDALLFYLPSSTTNDFVAIEMVNRKMRFVWNVGGGLGEVTHPHHIQTAGDLSRDQHWYKVEAIRIGNIGQLRVRPVLVPEGSPLADTGYLTNSSAPGIGRLDLAPGDKVWVGGADRRIPHLLHSTGTGLVGCLHRLYLNGRPIGLWDFSTQNPDSCTACLEGAEELRDESSYSFSGDGYAVLRHDSASAYNKYLFSMALSFRSYDANALLFIGIGADQDKFISLTLQEGRLEARIGYGPNSHLEMSTVEKYNSGEWTTIEVSRYFDRKKKLERGLLKVGKEEIGGSPTPPPSQDMIPDMSEAKYFVGGLPSGVVLERRGELPGAFLGCMKDIQIDTGGYSLLKGQHWGVRPGCSTEPVTVAGFHGLGYIELASFSLRKRDSFGFSFSTRQSEALLMLSTFEGLIGPLDEKEEMTNLIEQEERLSYYSVSLLRGQVDVRLNAGRGEVRLASVSSDYGDGKYHTLWLSKSGRRLELRVDDSLDSSATLPPPSESSPSSVRAPGELGGLYFGGLPPGFNTSGRTFSSVPLIGTIRDVIFNDKVIGFERPIRLEEVRIGRPGPDSSSRGGGSDGASGRQSGGCRSPGSHSVESGAVRFGDTPQSFLQLALRRRARLQNNFTIQLDFRTFYPNGLIFIIPGVKGKQPHYLSAALRNGRVQIVLKGKRKIETTAQAVFNDGVWHKMTLEKEDKRMTLRVDAIDPEKSRTPKRLNLGSLMYIGGLPQTGGLLVPQPLLAKLEPWKGCMRSLRVNGQSEPLISANSSLPSGVGQCFPLVERGSYFPGDSFALYKTKFNMGTLVELELELRTSELNGIILSVSEPEGYPALSLELSKGKVVLSGDMGDRRPFRLEQGLTSEFALCDNRWHRLEASFVGESVSLRVDNLEQSYWLSDNGHLTQATTHSPLYIGGVPESASFGTLETRENFKGCIRNVIVNGERKDWTDMAELHHVLLSSCPVAK